MKVVFLDMDGVLNSTAFFRSSRYNDRGEWGSLSFGSAQIDPEAVARLDRLLDATDAAVVISSSWRHLWSHEEIAAMLESVGFKHKDSVIGSTDDIAHESRGTEVQQWLELGRERQVVAPEAEPVTNYVILDDNDEFAGDQRHHFVHTNPVHGLTDKDVQKAISILSRS